VRAIARGASSQVRVADFDFELPEALVALEPIEPRDAARLLVVRPAAAFEDRLVGALPALLRPGDVVVMNDTRVIAAALEGVRRRGEVTAKVAVNLVKRIGAARWQAFARPAKRLAVGDVIACQRADAPPLVAQVEARHDGGLVDLAFDRAGGELDAAIEAIGAAPLPPYIALKRAPRAQDAARYQTVFARAPGAVAAPTAGLHMTAELIGRLAEAGIAHHFVTLHVGAGTFLPVKVEDTRDHVMHAEWGEVTAETAAALTAAKAAGRRIVALGTTALRLLESASGDDGVVAPFRGETAIFITPGYRFRTVDVLMTNFHLPRSTLFMLVAAFAGLDTMRAAYAHAIARRYRFYSYGDASLLFRADPKQVDTTRKASRGPSTGERRGGRPA
jgi:S-adenosylmethionine:tRNA ribosyltransferase-isomerase